MRVLAHLACYPGLTCFELARALQFTPRLPPTGRCSDAPVAFCLERLAESALAVSVDEPCRFGDFGKHKFRRLWYAIGPDGLPVRRPDVPQPASADDGGGCGTYAGYQRHIRRKETPCRPCNDARIRYRGEWREQASRAKRPVKVPA